jgi:hypothetical protein
MLKRFWEISEIEDKELRESFSDFSGLNKIIERENLTREQLEKAYADVIIWELNQLDYKELHFQIKYLLDEVGVAVNSIINFYDSKVVPYLHASIELINNLNVPKDLKDNVVSFLNYGNKSGKMWFLVKTNWDETYNEIVIDKKKMSDEYIYKLLEKWNNALKEKSKLNIPVFAWFKIYQ